MWRITGIPLALVILSGACGDSDPDPNGGDEIEDDAITGAACAPAPSYFEDLADCVPLATDFEPGSATDGWDACISDDDTYHRIEDSISSIARVEAFDAIGDLLWEDGAAPDHLDFIAARVLFEEEQGIGSRVARRHDVHFGPPTSGECEEEGVADANPVYCVGPATLLPLIVSAFADGATGKNRIIRAAEIEAALQWFLYLSVIKEATTCTDAPKDCDSSWAYYTGGMDRDAPSGLAADIDAVAPGTHDRTFDGVLALRCWRHLDDAVPAVDTARRDRAIAQLDTALLRGMAVLIRQRFAALGCTTGDYQEASLAALRILVPLLDRETRERDATVAALLAAEITKEAGAVDITGVLDAIDATYPCP